MIWYPYVQMKKMKTPYKIVDAEGVYLYTQDNKMIDSVSSWWCMIHGYKNKEINEAMKNQIDQFSHVMLGGLTHEPVLKLSEIIYVFLTIFLYLLKCPQSLILSALRAFCFCGKPHISRSIFLYFLYHT